MRRCRYVCTPEQILLENKPVGDNVLVIDGDGYFTGVSIAEYLADRGKHVKILTPLRAWRRTRTSRSRRRTCIA